MKTPLCFIALVTLMGCGGGGADVSATLANPPATMRTDLNYGYFGTLEAQPEETKDHVNFVLDLNWDGLAKQRLTQHRMKTMLGVEQYVYANGYVQDSEVLRARLLELKNERLLDLVFGFYPADEPDLTGMSADSIAKGVAQIRTVAAEFGMQPIIGTIYSNVENLPAIEVFDIVGFDKYPMKEAIFTNGDYTKFKSRVNPNQKIWLVPGGYSTYRQDPAPFMNVANNDLQVWGIIPFIWADANGVPGIRSNGMAPAYIAAGKAALGR